MPKIHHINPGETYLVRQWDDMESEYGLRPSGSIKCPGGFTTKMRYLCGSFLTAPKVLGSDGRFRIPMEDDPDDTWVVSPDMLELPIQNVNGDD